MVRNGEFGKFSSVLCFAFCFCDVELCTTVSVFMTYIKGQHLVTMCTGHKYIWDGSLELTGVS